MKFFSKYKNVVSGLSINAMESFCFVLYGYYATLIAPIFFPDQDPKVAQLKALLVFAAMFVMKPLGGLIFGHIGDKYGRKTSLISSVLVISLPTFFIGILPGYDVLGVSASILLVLLLSIQGLGAAAAYSGAAIFLNEHATPQTKSLFSGFLFSAAFFGAASASLLGIYFVSNYPTWGWRVVFVIGAFLGLCILLLRHNLEETPLFKSNLAKRKPGQKVPIKAMLTKRVRSFICTVGIAAGANLPFYIILIYVNTILSSDLGVSNPEILIHNVLILLFWTAALPFMGYLGDKVGEKQLMMAAALLLILIPVPLMHWFTTHKNIETLLIGRFILSIAAMGIVAPCSSYLARLFPVEERQTGVGFGYLLGAALFGGTAPSVCLFFTEYFKTDLFPGIYLAIFGLITFLCLKASKVTDS